MNIEEIRQRIGQPPVSGKWVSITQNDINVFADLTGDHQYIHVDEARAKESWLGGTVSHGLLVLSLLPGLAEGVIPALNNVTMGLNYGFDKVRFVSPVRPGDEVRMCASVVALEEKNPGRYILKLAVTIEIKDQEKPAIACEWLNMFICG